MAQTANYGFEKPSTDKNVDEEFYQLQETLDLLDSILAALQTAVNGKAAATHTHAITDIVNLAAELAAKMPASATFKLDDLTDVSGADGAPNGYVLVKSALGWLPSSALAALGPHGHLISEITGLVDALAGKADAAATTSALAGKVDKTTTLTAGTGLTGGGDLSSGRTISADIASQAEAEAGSSGTKLMTPQRASQAAASRNARFLHVRDQKVQGTAAGGVSAGATVTRTINATVVSGIAGASLNGSNQITLPSGTYDVKVKIPAYNTGNTPCWIRNVANDAVLAQAQTTFCGNLANASQETVLIEARITLTEETTIDVRMRPSQTVSNGLGVANNLTGFVEIYTDVMIWKVD